MKTAKEWKREAWRLKGISDNDFASIQADAREGPLDVLQLLVDNLSDGDLCGVCGTLRCSAECARVRALTLLADAPARTEPTADDLEVLRALRSFFELDWRRIIDVRAETIGGYAALGYTAFIETNLNTADALLAEPDAAGGSTGDRA